MKICFISPKAYPLFNSEIESTVGGAEVQLYMLSKELAKRDDVDVDFIVADYNQQNMEVYDDVRVWKSIRFDNSLPLKLGKFLKVFNTINADFYVQRTLTLESTFIAIYCLLRGKKFVYMVAHDSETDGKHRFYKNILTSLWSSLMFFLASKIIVQNEYQRGFLIKKYKKFKIQILKKGINIPRLYSNIKKEYDALWIGRSEKWKRPEMFIDLARKETELKFLMICPRSNTDPLYFDFLEKEAEFLDNLDFVEHIPYEKIFKKIQKCKLFVLTSEQEGDWPMTVLDCASCKLPIISFSLNYDYLIDEYEGGAFCEGDLDVMYNTFRVLVNDSTKLEEMGEGAYKYVVENHDIGVNSIKFLEIIGGTK